MAEFPGDPQAFADTIMGRSISLYITRAQERRLAAHIARLDRDMPGLGQEPEEPWDAALNVTVGALLDFALDKVEADAGFQATLDGYLIPTRGPESAAPQERQP